MGDFYIYFRKNGTTTFGVCTNDLSLDFMQRRTKHLRVAEDEVALWNWRYNCPLILKYSSIKNMTPLSDVLKNDAHQ